MQTLSTDDLLTAWERGREEPDAARLALTLLAVAYPNVSSVALAELSIGERDSLLLAMRTQVFGSHLDGLVSCNSCGETLEVEFDLPSLQVPAPRTPSRTVDGSLFLQSGDYELSFRVPNSADLLEISRCLGQGLKENRNRLLERVIVRAAQSSNEITFSDLPELLLAEVERAIQEADPQANIQLNLTCQACGSQWRSPFDIVSFLWRELDAWSIRLLREVHTLARAYGWREADILHMRPWRRHCYLEMLGA